MSFAAPCASSLLGLVHAAPAGTPRAPCRRAPRSRGSLRDCVRVVADACRLREVAFGADGLAQGATMKLLVNTYTVGVPFVQEIEQAMVARGVTVVNCPISGGPPGARAGTFSVMVSGDLAAVERVPVDDLAVGSHMTVAGDKPGAACSTSATSSALSTAGSRRGRCTIVSRRARSGRLSVTVRKKRKAETSLLMLGGCMPVCVWRSWKRRRSSAVPVSG